MASAIAFFPWIGLREPITVGSLRILPYRRGQEPAGCPHATLHDIDNVLGAYAVRSNQQVTRATLVEYGDWHLGQDADATIPTTLFRIRELVAFAALTRRRLFRGHGSGYCNFDSYAFVIQNYQAGSAGTFSFSTRHRDGSANHLWNSDEFAFMKPLHVNTNNWLDVDQPLLAALLQADAVDGLAFNAIVEFNRANTDSLDIPRHVEVVLAKSAFEFLFGISEKVPEFVSALNASIPHRSVDAAPAGPLAQRWRDARPTASRPLEAWAREFCDLRGGAAHGKKRGGDRFVWSDDAHLAFAAILFPLLFKQQLAKQGHLVLDERDVIELNLVENYLMFDPFAAMDRHQVHEHPWSAFYTQDVLGEVLRRGLLERLRTSDWQSLSGNDSKPESQTD